MKKTITLLALSTLFSLISCWNGAFAQEPLTFTGSILNPVLVHGDPGTYDGDLLVAPYALWDDGTFYLYYGGNGGGCIATSPDGYNYYKFSGNPVITPSGIGFDSLGAGFGPVVKIAASEYVMYYNARHYPGWGPGESVGRATANNPTGPWQRYSEPVLTGSPEDWDQGLICPLSVIPQDNGGFFMFYYASDDFNNAWLLGMATSPDGITWTKYNDPATTDPPFADSDPILPAGASGEFDEWGVLGAGVFTAGGYYHMYYSGLGPDPVMGYRTDIGYAFSTDGINWEKWPENPIYTQENDPYFDANTMIIEQPTILVKDSTIYLYYDYGVLINSLGMATAENVWVGINGNRIPGDGLRITNHPNPAIESTTFSYTLNEPMHVKLEIIDGFGQLVDVLINTKQQQGEQRVVCNTEAYPAGIYFYRLQSDDTTCGGKMVVVK